MECSNIKELMSLYIDNQLKEEEQAEFEEHIKTCNECSEEFISYQKLIYELNELPLLELPEGYHAMLMEKIRPKNKLFAFKRYSAVAAMLLLAFFTMSMLWLLPNLGNSSKNSSTSSNTRRDAEAMFDSGIMEDVVQSETAGQAGMAEQLWLFSEPEEIQQDLRKVNDMSEVILYENAIAGGIGASVVSPVGEKLQKTVSITITVEDINEAVRVINTLDGYNTSSNIYFYDAALNNQYGEANITRRVTSNSLEFARDVLTTIGNTVNESESQVNYSDEYADLAVRAVNAQNEITRLNELIAKSNSLDNIIVIESRISEINYNLDSYMGRMRQIDSFTSQPYIYIYISTDYPNTYQIEPISFSVRISEAFSASVRFTQDVMEGFMLFIVSAFIPLLIITACILLIFLMYRKISRRGRL